MAKGTIRKAKRKGAKDLWDWVGGKVSKESYGYTNKTLS